MKKVNFIKVEKLEKYSNWLKNCYYYNGNKKFKSQNSYFNYMRLAIADLCLNADQFLSINQPGILKSILKSLLNSSLFNNRSKKLQSDIVSSFKAYIAFHAAQQNIA
jgi:hypothetical protein